ncbi:MAG: glycosyltransferase [Planctomycetota bacterium]
MRILLVEPAHDSRARGNTTTVHRWVEGLLRHGDSVRRLRPGELDAAAAACDLVHAHHALHAGEAALAFAREHGLPFVLSLGGTDLDGADGAGPEPRTLAVVAAASIVIGPFDENASRLAAALGAAPRFQRVRRGVVVPPRPAALRAGDPLRLLLAGGLRRAKGQDVALRWCESAREQGLDVELVLAGPVVEEDYARDIARVARRESWVRWIGEVPPERMPHLHARIDVVLNTSAHEGASNAILEGLAQGRVVLARRAPGNEELLRRAPDRAARLAAVDGLAAVTGFLQDVARDDRGRRARRAAAARAFAREEYGAARELAELRRAYERALASGPPRPS